MDPANSNPPLDKLYVDVQPIGDIGASSAEDPVLAVRPVDIPDVSSTPFSGTNQDASIDISADPGYSAILPNQMAGDDSEGESHHELDQDKISQLEHWMVDFPSNQELTRDSAMNYLAGCIQRHNEQHPDSDDYTVWLPEIQDVLARTGLDAEHQDAGSDWKSTHYSRGSYTAPNMDPKNFQQFTQTGDYVSNQHLANGAADAFQPASALRAGKVGPDSQYPQFDVPSSDFSA